MTNMTNNDIINMLSEKRDSIEKQITDRVEKLLHDIEYANRQKYGSPALVIAQSLHNYYDIAELFGEYTAYAKAVDKAEFIEWKNEIDAGKGGAHETESGTN